MEFDRKKLMNIIIYISMGLLVVLLLVSIIVGSNNNSTKQNEENDNDTNDETYQYSPPADELSKAKEREESTPAQEELEQVQDGEIWEEHEDIEIVPQEIDESELPASYEEVYEEDDVRASRKVVEKFIEIIHNVDGDDPMKHIEDSKDYMTENLYERLQEEYEQGQMAWTYGIKQKYESSEIYEPATTRVKDGIVWAVNVKGTIQYHDDEEKERTDIYLIHLKKVDDEYRVNDFLMNVPT